MKQGEKVKTFIGSYYIDKNSAGCGENYTAYQIVDYVGHDHILVREVGWSNGNAELTNRGQYGIIHLGSECTRKTSIIEIKKFIEDFQKSRFWFYFSEKEVEEKLTDLSIEGYRCSRAEDIDEWIKSLTKDKFINYKHLL